MFVALSVAYPLVVYWAMGRFEPRWLAVLLLVLALLRALATRQAVWLVAAACCGLCRACWLIVRWVAKPHGPAIP